MQRGYIRGATPYERAMFFVRAMRDARFASKKNLLFRAAKHVFIWFVSLSRDKEMNTIIFPKKNMFAVLPLLSKNLLQTKKERTEHPIEQPVMFILCVGKERTKESLFRLREMASFPCSQSEHRASANGKRCAHGEFP